MVGVGEWVGAVLRTSPSRTAQRCLHSSYRQAHASIRGSPRVHLKCFHTWHHAHAYAHERRWSVSVRVMCSNVRTWSTRMHECQSSVGVMFGMFCCSVCARICASGGGGLQHCICVYVCVLVRVRVCVWGGGVNQTDKQTDRHEAKSKPHSPWPVQHSEKRGVCGSINPLEDLWHRRWGRAIVSAYGNGHDASTRQERNKSPSHPRDISL
jgi:hypothetical protein